MDDPFAPRTIELSETAPSEPAPTSTAPESPGAAAPFTAPAGSAEPPSVPEPAGGPTGPGGRFSFLKGRLAKIILILLIILIPVSVYIVYNYTTIFGPKAVISCIDDSDCPPGYVCQNGICVLPFHKECQNEACVTVPGSGTDQCSVDANCVAPTCEPQGGPCTSGTDCCVGLVCDNGSCQPTHKACQNNACVSVTGGGSDTCTSDQDCASATCQPQGGSCATNTDCCVGLVCSNNNTCQPPTGGCGISATVSGTTQCAKGGTAGVDITLTNTCGTAGTVRYQKAEASCSSATGSQSGCTACGVQLGSEQSITVAGNSTGTITASAGVPKCGVAQVDIKITSGTTNYVGQDFGAAYWDNSGCGIQPPPPPPPPPAPPPPPPTPPPPPPPPAPQVYRICENQACVTKTGQGSNLCDKKEDCQNLTHKECINQACRVVSGGGKDLCDNDTQCQVPSHKECRSNSCVVISGPGKDQCANNKDCGGKVVVPPPPAVPQPGSPLQSIVGLGVGLILTVLGAAALLF